MRPAVLLIGGMDSSGGAGLLRDAAAVAQAGGCARVAVTAVTAQTGTGVAAIHPVPGAVVAAQIAAALQADNPPGSIKVGMLAQADIASAALQALAGHDQPLVLDPVLSASSGPRLLDAAGLRVLCRDWLPRSTLLTPNLPELVQIARALGTAGTDLAGMAAACLTAGAGAVLVKGGHGEGTRSTDLLFTPGGAAPLVFDGPRHPLSLRGTGCQLASLIATYLARGLPLPLAIARARAGVEARFAAAIQAVTATLPPPPPGLI